MTSTHFSEFLSLMESRVPKNIWKNPVSPIWYELYLLVFFFLQILDLKFQPDWLTCQSKNLVFYIIFELRKFLTILMEK